MLRVRSAVLSLVLVGCSSGEAPVVPLAASASAPSAAGPLSSAQIVTSVPVEEAPAALDDELLARLAKEKLVGFVVADPRALYFATESAARSAKVALRPEPARLTGVRKPEVVGDGLRALEDLGEVVRVSTEGVEDLGKVDGRFKLEVFVLRSALLPVLRAPRKESFPDGTAVLLREGLVVEPLRGGPRPARKLLSKVLSAPPDAADVGLSFESPSERPRIDPLEKSLIGPELGCDRESAGTDDYKLRVRVDDRTMMIQEESRERSEGDGDGYGLGAMGHGNQYSFRCTFGGDSSVYVGVEDGVLRINGRDLGRASEVPLDACTGQVSARRIPADEDTALVTMDLPRAQLRVRTTRKSLIEGGGCGAGRMGGARPTVKAVIHKAIAYFPDGTEAGVHTGYSTKLERLGDVTQSGGRTCVAPAYLTTLLCFDAADLEDVKD